ncbi:MAG TPA: acylphosphatase [Candidatus Coprovicinus avistercoris]|uniref:acylphosphatase n=1 Tax=Candidatus Coprovicinus avistercoris TaxID=2840754 RepID=A0A9D1L556_9ACTN|nr:acylphosphatase [Candidatus Coprovicinus avistercoris]
MSTDTYDISDETIRRVALRFEGTVQAVGFRWTCCMIAKRVGCTGWVRNELDGSVSMELQGTNDAIASFFGMLQADYNRRHLTFVVTESDDIAPVEGENELSVRWA